MNTEKILKYAGLAAASRSLVCGSDLVMKEIRKKGGALCVLLSSDASDRTKKQIRDKCAFYNVFLCELDCDMYDLAKRFGKLSPQAVVAVKNPGLCREIKKCAAEDREG